MMMPTNEIVSWTMPDANFVKVRGNQMRKLKSAATQSSRRTLLVSLLSSSFLLGAVPDYAFGNVLQEAWDFEHPPSRSANNGISGWTISGGAGFDNGAGYSLNGQGNGWVRNKTGWNALNNLVDLRTAPAGAQCSFTAWLRTSDYLSAGYMSVRDGEKGDGSGTILREQRLVGARTCASDHNGYAFTTVKFSRPQSGRVLVYVGLWGHDEDVWIQIDDAAVSCQW
jgi:hypothetical protein